MQNSDFYQAEEYLKLGLYPQAFEAFMALEVGSLECTFLKPLYDGFRWSAESIPVRNSVSRARARDQE